MSDSWNPYGEIAVARSQLLALIRHAGAEVGTPDADLLGRFVSAGDQTAFAELVRRYARLVWGQCRNLLSNEADADDAFQATFLALAKSATSVRDTDRLGPWLHAVAHRVCLNARRAAARRTKRERTSAVPEGSRPVADSAWDAAAAAVHEEVNRLPEAQRVAFVLCGLEGIAPTAAAERLGLPWGTFSSRLSRAKQRLLERLAARGIGAAVAVGAVGAGVVPASAAVARAITLGFKGASIPASVLSLLPGVVVMGVSRGKLLAVLAMAVAGVAGLLCPAGGGPGVPVAFAAPVPKGAAVVKGRKLDELWKMLARNEADSSRALLEFTARPKAEVVAFLAGQLKPLKLTEERAKQLIADLGSEKEEVAKAALEETHYFDLRLGVTLEDAMAGIPEGVHRQRVLAALTHGELDTYAWCTLALRFPGRNPANAKWKFPPNVNAVEMPNKPPGFKTFLDGRNIAMAVTETVAELSVPPWTQATRGVMLLEHLGTPDAVKALEAMATGHADAGPTVAAKDALERLKKK